MGRTVTGSRRVRWAPRVWAPLLATMLLAGSPPLAIATAAGSDVPPAPRSSPRAGCGTPEQCFARMTRAQRDVARIDARFRQTKHVALLAEPLVSEGRFSFERPERVRWEMVTPEPMVVEVTGSELRAGPPGEVAAVDAGPAVALFRDLAGIFTGAHDYAGKRFVLGPGTSEGNSFILTPRDPSVGRILSSIVIDLDPASGEPRRVLIAEAGGDRTEIELFDVVVERKGGAGPGS